MKKKNNVLSEYKYLRDSWLQAGCKPRAAFYQALIVQEVGRMPFSFHKKAYLEQHRQILHDMLSEILATDNGNYQIGVYYEMILSAGESRLSGNELECQKCTECFALCDNVEYNFGTYQLHISNIVEIADTDIQAAQLYADNLLKLLEWRYGIDSWQYAKMKLHIIGEYYYAYRRDVFMHLIEENYEYLRQYTAEKDSFFAEVLSMYAYWIREGASDNYELWIKRCEEAIEQRHGDEFYNFLKCKVAWVKAKVLEEQKQNEAALQLLQEVIEKYLVNEQKGRNHIFYGSVYLLAVNICFKMHDKIKMLYYTQKGLAVCEALNKKESELYYNLYNFIGISYTWEQRWGDAEALYSRSIQNIERKYGIENENYAAYLGNLALAAFNQGKNVDVYIEKMKKIESKILRRKFRSVFNNELIFAIGRGNSLNDINRIYTRCIRMLEGEEDIQEKIRLDTIYLSFRAYNKPDNKAGELIRKLEANYEYDFEDEMAIQYWDARAVFAWKQGDLQAATRIYKEIVPKMKLEEYWKYRNIISNYIQLLIIEKQHGEAKKILLLLLNMTKEQVLARGLGNISHELLFIRNLLSMFIYSMIVDGRLENKEESEIKNLFEEIVFCKTIEREMKGVLGKYTEKEGEMDWYYYQQAHRRLAALEMQHEEKMPEDIDYYKKRKEECLLDMGKYEACLNQKIPFNDIVHKWRFDEIDIPDNTVCVEYFAYFKFNLEQPMLIAKNIDERYNYLAFILAKNKREKRIIDIYNICLEETLEEEVTFLLEMSEGEEREGTDGDADEILQHLNSLFALPALKYIERKNRIYLGLDFVLHMLPMDLIFSCNEKKFLDVILVDSMRYVGEDTTINMEEATALIIGAPKFDIIGQNDLSPLPGAKIECSAIAEMFGEKAYIGVEAKQKVLWGKRKDVIHISTHGMVISNAGGDVVESDVFTDSYLLLAGFLDWKYGKRVEDYGNGIVSGDDFLFMDLSQTKLVVLSACVSGLGFPRGLDSPHGMRWAIGTAGAENSITTLWSVPDSVSAVLMILFYRNLQSTPIGKALYEAKMNMQSMTASDLREDEVLIGLAKEWVLDKPDDYKPFNHWKYWAGFVCYHR